MKKVYVFLFNCLIALVSISIFFGILEAYARYRYFGGHLTEKRFYSRGKQFTLKKQTPVRIVCVGGSTTQGGAVEDIETYPFYLEEIINKQIGKHFVEVINSGIPATPTEYHRDLIKQRIGDQELDMIVLHSFYNHFSSFYPSSYNSKVDKIFIDRTSKVRTKYYWNRMNIFEALNIILMEHSYFYTRLREKIVKLSHKDIGAYYAKKNRLVYGEDIDTRRIVETEEAKKAVLTEYVNRYYSAIEDIILTARDRKVEVVLVMPPYPLIQEEAVYNTIDFRSKQYFNTVFEKGRDALIALAKRYDLLIVDADEGFINHGIDASLFMDSVHLTPKGNHLLAEIIASALVPHLLSGSHQ